MHSRIIELSKTPIEVDERICESDYYDNGFVGNIADYVNGDTDRTYDIEWFTGYLKEMDLLTVSNEERITFSNDIKEKFFRKKYEEFKKLTSELTFDEFTNASGYQLYLIKNCIEDKFGFYIHYDGCYYTLEAFMKYYANDNDTWYFGGTIDYHS